MRVRHGRSRGVCLYLFPGGTGHGLGRHLQHEVHQHHALQNGLHQRPTPAVSDAVTDDAVNLAYTLGLSATTGTGSGVDQAYSVSGSMALGQAGTCLTAACTNAAATNKVRTLYVVY
jgi:hypothetical protein